MHRNRNTWVKLSSIIRYARKNPEMQFTSLAHLLDEEFLRDCYRGLDRNKAVGIDGVTWEKYGENLEENLKELVKRLKNKSYKPIPARRVYIPKDRNSKRPLGISAIENKVVEKGIMHTLESIYEVDFLETSYGFRRDRNCHQALMAVNRQIMSCPVNHVVEADIKGFFDNVNHEKLLKFLRKRIVDSSLLSLIEKFLKAGYMEDEKLIRDENGTPQGSILSPILANVFLHYVLDMWFEKTVKLHTEGYCELTRYADDFVITVQYMRDAEKIERALENRFNKYDLEIHPDKSGRKSFGRFERQNAEKQNRKPNTFNFLGFTHFCDTTRNGKFKLGVRTRAKKFRASLKKLYEWLKSVRNIVDIKEWWKTLKAKLRGHFQYYGISGNMPMLKAFYKQALRMVFKWLNRRSQKQSMYWEGFHTYLSKYPLPEPEIKHDFYTLNQPEELSRRAGCRKTTSPVL